MMLLTMFRLTDVHNIKIVLFSDALRHELFYTGHPPLGQRARMPESD